MLPIQRKISPYNHYNGNNIQYIIIHYTGNKGDTAKNNADYFYGGNRQASAHYFVDNNSIWQVVEEHNSAWHIGNSVREPSNRNSIGIEMCCQKNGQVSEQTENNTVELVQYLMNKWNIDINHVWTHYECTRGGENKICPNWSENNWARWNNFKQKVVSGVKEEQELLVNIKDYFVEEYYAKMNPDVVKVYGNSRERLYEHYKTYGIKEKRKPNAMPNDWNEAYYLINNPDVNDAVSKGEGWASGLHHFIICGWKEKRVYNKLINQENNKQEENKTNETFYRVVTGSYKDRENADEQLNKLKEAGFESFIDIYKK